MKLQSLRKRIDQLDSQLLKLLNRRTRLAADIGHLKRANGQAIFAPEREEQLLKTLNKRNHGPLSNSGLRAIYREIFSSSRASQKRIAIGCLGKKFSEAFYAAQTRFGASDEYVAVASLPQLLGKLERGSVQAGVVPSKDFDAGLKNKKISKRLKRGFVIGQIKNEKKLYYLLSTS
jgi:chorismate mutase/prephenate dehydratase